jgi:hypothetical protein
MKTSRWQDQRLSRGETDNNLGNMNGEPSDGNLSGRKPDWVVSPRRGRQVSCDSLK